MNTNMVTAAALPPANVSAVPSVPWHPNDTMGFGKNLPILEPPVLNQRTPIHADEWKGQQRHQQHERRHDRIAFGSCNDQDRQNNMWEIIADRQPSGFIWGGDAIYADTHHPTDWSTFPPTPSWTQCGTPEHVEQLYRDQLQVPEYRELLEQNPDLTIFGTIDDHDYGCNNADKTFDHKHATTQSFIDFLGLEEDSTMAQRAKAGDGVYGVQLFDFALDHGSHAISEQDARIDPDIVQRIEQRQPQHAAATGISQYIPSNRTVAIFVLDVRTNKDPWRTGADAVTPDFDGDFLGPKQWTWFEQAIMNSPATINVIVTGLQVEADIVPDPNLAESWSRFPSSQRRLFNTVLNAPGSPILVSGDVHMTQMMRMDCMQEGSDQPQSLFEMTTSGMTHSWGTITNPHHNAPSSITWRDHLHALLSRTFMHTLHQLNPWTTLLRKDYADGGLQYSLEKNFGELEFDWDRQAVTMRTIGEQRQVLLQHTSTLNDQEPLMHLTFEDFAQEAEARRRQQQHPGGDGAEWICLPHRGRVTRSYIWLRWTITAAILIGGITVPIVTLCYLVWRRFKLWLRHNDDSMTTMPSLRPIY